MISLTHLSLNLSATASAALRRQGWDPGVGPLSLPPGPDGEVLSLEDLDSVADLVLTCWSGSAPSVPGSRIVSRVVSSSPGRYRCYLEALASDAAFVAALDDALSSWYRATLRGYSQVSDLEVLVLRCGYRLSSHDLDFFALHPWRLSGFPVGKERWELTVVVPRSLADLLLAREPGYVLFSRGPALEELFPSEEVLEIAFSLWEPGELSLLGAFDQALWAAQSLGG